MTQALYRKHRSKSLSEIVGQKHITDTLERAIKNGKISHAYLFTGPKGVGKTSIARILAHEVNNLPYTDESVNLDIIEIDAASNRRIDEIRELRDKVHISPTSAKYKVYIIDEVHMLTKEAFNALLKTLEEPPAHVIFILATTEVHKLPDTIISRTQRFTFKAIDDANALGHLKDIAKKEGIKIEQDALELLVNHSGGSFRDSISLLDQVAGSHKSVNKQDVENLLGVAPTEAIVQLLDAVFMGTSSDIVKGLDNFTTLGISPAQIAKQFVKHLRHLLLNSSDHNPSKIIDFMDSLLRVQSSSDPASALEIVLFNANLKDTASKTTTHEAIRNDAPVTIKKPDIVKTTENTIKNIEEPIKVVTVNGEDISSWWPEFMNSIKKHNNTLYGVLRMAHPTLDKDILTLGFAFGFHAKKVTDPSTLSKLHEALQQLTGKNLTIKTNNDKSLKGIEPKVTRKDISMTDEIENILNNDTSQDISLITNIFGGGEVLDN